MTIDKFARNPGEAVGEALGNATDRDSGQVNTADIGNFRVNWLFDRIAPHVLDSLTDQQKKAISQVVRDPSWNEPPVNVRLGLPLGLRRYYITIVAGAEKRDPERRAEDRTQYPLRSAANIFFFVGLATLFYVLVLIGIAASRMTWA